MGERVEERTGGNREFTGEAYAQGAAGVAEVSLIQELGFSWEWWGWGRHRDLGFSSSSAHLTFHLGQVTAPRWASASPPHCGSGDTEAQRRAGLALTCTQPANQRQSQARTQDSLSQARALSLPL